MSLKPKHFHELLGYKFIIPPYQRGYRWDKEQVEALLEDFKDFIISVRKARISKGLVDSFYCLQPLTVVNAGEKDTYHIIDGQQRLTTIYLLLTYLKNNRNFQIYSLSMPSRKVQDEYLSKNLFLDPESDYRANIDNFYIHQAYSAITAWFDRNDNETIKQEFCNLLVSKPMFEGDILNDVRIIWYEISGQTALQAFRRLNYGKIPLTSTELVKALLLQGDISDDRQSVSQSATYRRAVEWDMMEHTLQNPYLWSMLVDSDDRPTNHLELVIDFVADNKNALMTDPVNNRPMFARKDRRQQTDKDSRDYFNYNVINEYLRRGGQKAADEIWNDIRDTFNLITNWFDNRLWFHLIGLLRIVQDRKPSRRDFLKLIYQLSSDNGQPVSRPVFTDRLTKLIGQSIRLTGDDSLGSIAYGVDNQKIIKILKAHNVLTAIEDETENNRFAFHLFEYFNVTSLEHIHPQNITTDATYDDFCNWFSTRCNDYANLNDSDWHTIVRNMHVSDDTEADETETIGRLKSETDGAIKTIGRLIVSSKSYHDDQNRQALEEPIRILDRLFGDLSGISETQLHSISNLSLVDGATNSALQNYFLNKKRSILMERHNRCGTSPRNGTYVPPATRKVFNKDYSRESPGDMRLWRPEDRKLYFNSIENAYNYFLNQID